MLFFYALFKRRRKTERNEIFTEGRADIHRYFNRLATLKNKDTIQRIAKVTTAM